MSIQTSGAPTADSPNADSQTETDEVSTAAASSTVDEGAQKPVDLLSVVTDAVAKPDEAEAESPAAEGKEEAEPKTEAEAEPGKGETDDAAQAEADKKLPFHEHPRWKEVIAERDGFKADAGRIRALDDFMETNGLSNEEVIEGFDVMAKLKSGDPKSLTEAREYFRSGLERLDAVLGNVLPDDLQQKVDDGLMDAEDAQELAKTRASAKLTQDRLQARETVDAEASEQGRRVAAARANATAVEGWEQRIKASDPDYSKKAALVETTSLAIAAREGFPRTPEEAVKLVERAYGEVNEHFKAFAPKPKPIAPSPRGSSTSATQEPKTLKEAIAAAASK